MRSVVLGAVVSAALLAGCSDGAPAPTADPTVPAATGSAAPGSTPKPSTSKPGEPSSTASDPGPLYSDWELGVHALPRTSAGFGEIRPTPKALRVRRYRTTDRLPPPSDDTFHSSIGPITPSIRRTMGETWSESCPVGLDGLRYLNVTFRGFDDRAHTGEIVVAADQAKGVVSVFKALFAAGFPIEEMRLPTTADLDAPPTGDGNNTAALVCRNTRGSTTLSAHAYGLAIDVNPFLNPYVKGDLVLPERASSYLDRTRTQPGIIHSGDLIVREFARIGWSWGGSFNSLKDYQHFTATGR